MSVDSRAAEAARFERRVFIFTGVVLIASFLFRVLTPAHELDGLEVQLLSMLFDLGCLVGLVGLRFRVDGMQALFWCALLAGLGLFGIRFTSNAAWYTGHLMYTLQPR